MMFTTPMTQVFAIVLERDSNAVTESLLAQGVMQFINVSEIEPDGPKNLLAHTPQTSLSDIADLRKRVEGFLHAADIVPDTPTQQDLKGHMPVDLEKENNHLGTIEAQRENIRERQRALQQDILKFQDIRRQLQSYGTGLSSVPLTTNQSFLSMQTGRIAAANVKKFTDALKGLPALSLELGRENDTVVMLLVSMKRLDSQIERICGANGWTAVDLPKELLSGGKDLTGELDEKIAALQSQQKELQQQATELVRGQADHLKHLWRRLRVNELCHTIEAHFKTSTHTVIFAGWVPSEKTGRITQGITAACQGRCYLECWAAGSKETIGTEVPVELHNPKMLAPFQMLVSNFGIPEYGTIDPTPFVMPIYLVMFGLMFADAGQGIVLAILGALGIHYFKHKKDKKPLYNLSGLMMWCGSASVLFGVLFGSYFGMALAPALWFDFHGIVSGHHSGNSHIANIGDVLAITIYFGITVIALGLLFNWVNLVRMRKWMELVFAPGGILCGWMYAGGIYTAFYMVEHDYKGFPSGGALWCLLGIPAILLFVNGPYHHYKHNRHAENKTSMLAAMPAFAMEWIVELLEIFSGYLSNTLSFMRVAGLGIAHVCLMISFFTLAEMTSGLWSILILIAGNILVIGLEGLSAGIQALRLNYYEFFTKFFHGTGKLHCPISLNSHNY